MFVSMLFPIIGCAVTGCGLKGDLEHPPHVKPIQEDVAFLLPQSTPATTPIEPNTGAHSVVVNTSQQPSAAY
jgi:predicted small lipoprotein YifL